jgi:hypothetical protein
MFFLRWDGMADRCHTHPALHGLSFGAPQRSALQFAMDMAEGLFSQ